MTQPKDNGGPAFPPFHDPKSHDSGMTLRDYFAAKVVVGELSSQSDADGWINTDVQFKGLAEKAYLIADAMLEARK